MSAGNVASITHTAAWRRGTELAIALLEEIGERSSEASLQEPGDGGELDQVLLRFLHRARDAGPLIERAFAAVLGDVLADHQADLQALEEIALAAPTVRRYATPAAAQSP